MRLLRRCLVLIALPVVALGGAAADRAAAQPADYPNRAVTFIVPFAPGGVTSLFARILGQKLEQRLGKPFVVENRPGGGGVTAATAVAHATPDGYTIMMASSTVLAINVTVRKNLPYDPRTQLTPIALLARVPFVLVVNPALPIHSVADLVKLAREKPGEIAFGTPGPGTFHHLNAEMFKGIFGLNLVHVPYKGSAPALNDLVGGHIQMMFCDVPPARSLIEAGKIRALGVTTKERVPAVAEIPPLARGRHPRLRHRVLAHRDHHRERAEADRRHALRQYPRDHERCFGHRHAGQGRHHPAGEPAARRDETLRRERDHALGQSGRAGGAGGVGIARVAGKPASGALGAAQAY